MDLEMEIKRRRQPTEYNYASIADIVDAMVKSLEIGGGLHGKMIRDEFLTRGWKLEKVKK